MEYCTCLYPIRLHCAVLHPPGYKCNYSNKCHKCGKVIKDD